MALEQTQLRSIELFGAAFLWGMYTILLFIMIFVMSSGRRRKLSRVYKFMLTIAVVMYGIAASHTTIVFIGSLRGKPTERLSQTAVALGVLQFCLSDIILTWRVWVVWNRNYWLVLPSIISWCFAMGFGFKQVADVTVHLDNIKVNSLPVASSIIIVINTTINTCLIVGRMLYMRHQLKSLGMNTNCVVSYGAISALFIESGSVITANQIACLILQGLGSPGVNVLLNFSPQLVGIIPTAIVLLVHLDLVPGTRVSEIYARTATSELRWAAASSNLGPTTVTSLSTTAFPSSQEESQIPTPTDQKDEKALNIAVALP